MKITWSCLTCKQRHNHLKKIIIVNKKVKYNQDKWNYNVFSVCVCVSMFVYLIYYFNFFLRSFRRGRLRFFIGHSLFFNGHFRFNSEDIFPVLFYIILYCHVLDFFLFIPGIYIFIIYAIIKHSPVITSLLMLITDAAQRKAYIRNVQTSLHVK